MTPPKAPPKVLGEIENSMQTGSSTSAP